ncbi:Adenylate cyclase 2 [Gemmata sp. SH-PL17]|uniref:response regulator n=1 Tax=Gemmata sp. SH-PL17 TaxID=1630693 RepID=UPI0004B415B6|nr:response regulator [Gemmata sp. SH-PL17]AMV25573.1 Adenylate cyclase 2 [Gemmata sp. SH-PL17]
MAGPPPVPAPNAVPDLPVILVADDSLLEQRYVGRLLEQQGGWRVAFARSGEEALAAITKSQPALLLTDMNMSGMDGLTLVEKVREQFARVPVVLMTGSGSERVAVAALKAGAADYVAKQSLAHDLIPVLDRVLSVGQAAHRRYQILQGMTRRSSQYIIESDPQLVPPLVAQFREDLIEMGLCDLTGATRAGIAIEEALLNAIYHGNLEVSSDLRENGDEEFHKLARERRGSEPYSARRVRVTARLTPARATFVILDQGPGFDVTKLPDPLDPEFIERASGRGVLLMRAFMDEVRYNATGNRVTLVKRRDRSSRDDS